MNQEVNFLIYGMLIVTIRLCVCRFVSREAFSIAALFTPFLLSTIDSGRPRRSQILFLGFFWVLCFAVFRNNFRFSMYPETHRIRQDSFECVYRYYERPGPTKCNIVYGEDLSTRLETARQLNISFYRAYLARRPGAR